MCFKYSYRCDVVEELAKKTNNVVYITIAFNETQSLTPRQVANDVEGEEL